MPVCETVFAEFVFGGSLSVVVKSPSEREYLLLCERLRDNQDAVRVALYNAVGGPTDSLAAAAPRENPGAAAAAGSGAAPDDGPYAGARGAATSAAPGRRPPNFGAYRKGYWAAHADRPPPLQRPPPLAVTTASAASTPTAEEPQSEPGTVAWLRAGAERERRQ